MRVALLSDIHGNSIALDAVLHDMELQGGVDAVWVLGDLVAIGPDPVGVLGRLSELPTMQCIHGNTDRYVTTGARPGPTIADVEENPALLPALIEVAQTFAWTQGAITAAGWFDWLAALPLELRAELPNGAQFLGVHASPGQDDGRGIPPTLDKRELVALLADCNADLICVGHTHWPLDIRVQGKHVVNLGSVSNPVTPDLRASYVLLEADTAGYQLRHRQVEYDREAVVTALQRIQHPGAAFIARHMIGQHKPPWVQPG